MAHEDDPDIDVPLNLKNPEGNVLGKKKKSYAIS
jgi:hypothetical protein